MERAHQYQVGAGFIFIGSLLLLWFLGFFVPTVVASGFAIFSLGVLAVEAIICTVYHAQYKAARGLQEETQRRRHEQAAQAQATAEQTARRQEAERAAGQAREEAKRQAERFQQEERERLRRQEAQASGDAARRQAEDTTRARRVLAAFRHHNSVPLADSPVMLYPGERCYHSVPVTMSVGTFSGMVRPAGQGMLVITDQRLVFQSTGKTFGVPIREILAMEPYEADGFLIQVDFSNHEYYIYRTAFPCEVVAFLLCMFYISELRPQVDPRFAQRFWASFGNERAN